MPSLPDLSALANFAPKLDTAAQPETPAQTPAPVPIAPSTVQPSSLLVREIEPAIAAPVLPALNVPATPSTQAESLSESERAIARPSVSQLDAIPTADLVDESPIDIVKELGVDIAALPYRPFDPLGWVKDIANEFWYDAQILLDFVCELKPVVPFEQVPTCPIHRQWAKLNSKSFEWEAIEIENLPEFLLPDIESIREGKGTETQEDPYRPVMVCALGADLFDSELGWYAWVDHLRPDIALLDAVPFPQGKVVVNHNISAYDRRYFSCEYEQIGPSSNKYIDTMALGTMIHGLSQQAKAPYKTFEKNVANGGGAPEWFRHACPASLSALVKQRLGIEMNKTVRQVFKKLTAAELAQELMDADNIQTTPTSLFQYCAQDVQRTFELFVSLYKEARHTFIQHPASWAGLTMLGGVRCYLDGLDNFIIRNDMLCDETKRTQIKNVIQRLAKKRFEQYAQTATVRAYTDLAEQCVTARIRLNEQEADKKSLRLASEEIEAKLQSESKQLAATALVREEAAAFALNIKGGRTVKQVNASEDAQTYKNAIASRDEATKEYKSLYKQHLATLAEKGDRTPEQLAEIDEQMKELRENIRVLKKFLSENKDDLESRRDCALAVGTEIDYALDWSVFSSGPRQGKVKWIAELEDADWSHGTQDAVVLLKFLWKGEPVRYEKNPDGKTGTWVTDSERLPHLGGGENLGSPLCNDYYRFLLDDTLTSAVLSQDELKALFKAVENTNQWTMYQKRYKSIYRRETQWGTLTTTDTLSGGTLSMRTTGLSAVLPKKSEKIGSEVQQLISAGKDRIVYERDFAAQESKFLAMLVNAWHGQSFSTTWSEAVLKGDKAQKTDIHNLVAIFCTSKLTEMWAAQSSQEGAAPEVERQAGKGLNFSSIYLCGVDKLAQGLIKDCDFPPALAQQVAEIFMDYIKGPNGIALNEFEMLSRIASIPGYRTAALGRKIAHSVDFAYAPKDFHTTRSNWTIQGGCTDLLHITLVVLWALCLEYNIEAFPLITVHDSLKCSVRPEDEETFGKLFDFAHAVAKQCAYQGATAWARKMRGVSDLPQVWCPASDIFFEERLEADGLPSALVAQ